MLITKKFFLSYEIAVLMYMYLQSAPRFLDAFTLIFVFHDNVHCFFHFVLQVIHFTSEDVATFIAVLGVLSVVSQVNNYQLVHECALDMRW